MSSVAAADPAAGGIANPALFRTAARAFCLRRLREKRRFHSRSQPPLDQKVMLMLIGQFMIVVYLNRWAYAAEGFHAHP